METMNIQNFKKYAFALFMGVSFVLASGLSSFSTVQAQNYQRRQNNTEFGRCIERHRNNDYGPVGSNGNVDLNRNGIDDRYEVDGQVDINQNCIPDNEENNGRFGRDRGYNGNNGVFGNRGYNNSDFQQGYREGLDHGRIDARANRAMNFNNSKYYRSGNTAYRDGFERGCSEAYQQFRNRRW